MVAPVKSNPIPELSQAVARELDRVGRLLPAGWTITLVCADPGNVKMSFMLSSESLERLDEILAHVRSESAGWSGAVRG